MGGGVGQFVVLGFLELNEASDEFQIQQDAQHNQVWSLNTAFLLGVAAATVNATSRNSTPFSVRH